MEGDDSVTRDSSNNPRKEEWELRRRTVLPVYAATVRGLEYVPAPPAYLPLAFSKVYTPWVSNITGTFRWVVVYSLNTVNIGAVGVRPAIKSEDPDSGVEAALAGLKGGLSLERRDEWEE
jgi:hypothetical protein